MLASILIASQFPEASVLLMRMLTCLSFNFHLLTRLLR